MQSLGKIEQRALAVGAKIWCLSLCFFSVCHAPRPERCSLEGTWFEQVLCDSLWVHFDAVFTFFQKGSAFQQQYMILIFRRWMASQISRNGGQKLRKVQESAEKFVRRTLYR